MSKDVIVRAAEPDDVSAVAELLAQPRALWGTLQLPYMSVEERRRRWASNPAHGHTVAVIDGRVIGWAHFTQYEGRRSHVGSLGMAVHDAFAGRGAGRALLAAILEKADRWLNLKRVELAVYVDNVRAIALYERFGFEREGLFRRYAFRDGDYADQHGAVAAVTPPPRERSTMHACSGSACQACGCNVARSERQC